MDWIIFGDDWGRHVSTTQHLALNLPPEDRVLWVDSIGMRSPRLADAKRVTNKISEMLRAPPPSDVQLYTGTVGELRRLTSKVIPWHLNSAARAVNRRLLSSAIAAQTTDFVDPVLVTVNPVAVDYVDGIPHRCLVYLRLDRYADYPGVDPELVGATEPRMFEHADIVAATARVLIPEEARVSLYLPQGVRFDHFAQVTTEPVASRIAGFYGLISRYLDYELIAKVADARPNWTFAFVGRPEAPLPADLICRDNVTVDDPVAFSELPALLDTWQVAWTPYMLNERTYAMNPLKLREYLVAGLPSHCTPIPDAKTVPEAFISGDADAICAWLDASDEDSAADRARRRAAMTGEDWSARAATLRSAVTA